MTRGELIQACSDAFVWANEGEIENVLNVAEPLIRRDEARRMNERWRTQVLDNERVQMQLDVLADLRAKVEALPAEHHYGSPPRCISRADVLDLIDGGGDE